MNRSLVRQVRALARDRCDYCRMLAIFDPLPFQTDHIISRQHGGETTLANLAWCSLHCNKHKGPNIAGIDPLTGQMAALFHPRRQSWHRHFAWDRPTVVGRTQTGRATAMVLAINDLDVIAFRAQLMDEGVF